MISPYLRRPLRSLDEILTRNSDDSTADHGRTPRLPKAASGARSRMIEPITADTKKPIASNP